MKKLFAAVLAAVLLLAGASGLCEEGAVMTVNFEDGFSLNVPEGWVRFEATEDQRQAGVVYVLGEADASRLMYVEILETELLDAQALSEAALSDARCENVQIQAFRGTEFVITDMPGENLTVAAAILGHSVLAFVFTPMDDVAYMTQAARIVESFSVSALDAE